MSEQQIPAASFDLLVSMLASQAMVAMGILNIPGQPKQEPNLEIAQHLIDLMNVLEEKTKGNLSDAEKSSLEQTLYQVRLTFVGAKEMAKKPIQE